MADNTRDDQVQHGIDDNPSGDAEKGAALGGLGGAAVGAAAGSLIGPVGTIIGAVVGGLTGAGASGLAVAAVDQVDNDNTVSGVGSGATDDVNRTSVNTTGGIPGISATGPLAGAMGGASMAGTDLTPGNNTPGVQTGGMTTAGADTRGITEKAADALTGDRTDDKTGGMTTGAMGTGVGATGAGAMNTGSDLRRVNRSEYDQLNEQDRLSVQLIEEELHVGKEMRQSGEVQVSTHVVEKQVNVPVTLQHEEVTITRHAVDRPVDASTTGEIFRDETITVPVHEEVAHVTKTAHVAEEIEIEKRKVSEQRTVSDTVRREELDVNPGTGTSVRTENTGNSGTSGSGKV